VEITDGKSSNEAIEIIYKEKQKASIKRPIVWIDYSKIKFIEVLYLGKKVIYINFTLKLRRFFDIIFYISILLYGNMLMLFYGKPNIGILNGIGIILSFLLMMLIISMTMETLFITSDPINKINVRKYRLMFFLRVVAVIITHCFGVNINYGKENILIYNLLIFVISGIIITIHNNIINKYKNMSDAIIEEMISVYNGSDERVTDVEVIYEKFIHFFAYCILLIFVYKYTLWRWEATLLFLIINIIVLKKFFWKGCKELYHNYGAYFCAICISSSVGIILMKLVYEQVIVLSVFMNRDEQELWMVLMLFYLPILRLGKDIHRRKKNITYIWKK
jgi:hypothetical protein